MNQLTEFKPSHDLTAFDIFFGAEYERGKQLAQIMSKAEGFTPPHLIGKSEACYAVVTQALLWRLYNVFAVAQSTYATPGGNVGYEGKLVISILEASGRLDGTLKFEHRGDWSKIRGRHKEATSQKGHKYQVSSWDPKDEEGLSVVVSAQVKGEAEPRSLEVFMKSCYPRNAVTWATRPEQQICYAAARAFASLCAPSLLMGVPFRDDIDDGMKDVTPARPVRDRVATDFDTPQIAAPAAAEQVDAETGEIFGVPDAVELGRVARRENKSLLAFPMEWNDEAYPEGYKFIDAFKWGWKEEADAEAAKKK